MTAHQQRRLRIARSPAYDTPESTRPRRPARPDATTICGTLLSTPRSRTDDATGTLIFDLITHSNEDLGAAALSCSMCAATPAMMEGLQEAFPGGTHVEAVGQFHQFGETLLFYVTRLTRSQPRLALLKADPRRGASDPLT